MEPFDLLDRLKFRERRLDVKSFAPHIEQINDQEGCPNVQYALQRYDALCLGRSILPK